MISKLRKPTVDLNKTKKENRYERFNFTRNPFPKSPGVTIGSDDPRENGSIYYPELVKIEEEQFEKLLIPKPGKQETNRIVFLMDYATRRGRGIGKTAFLNYERKRIMEDFGEKLTGGEHIIFAVYVSPIPGENYNRFWKISRLIIKKMTEQNIIANAVCRLRAFSGIIPENILEKIGDDLIDTLGNDSWLQDNGINTMILNNKVKSDLEKLNIDSDLAKSLSFSGCSESDFLKYMNNLPDSFWRKDENRFLFTHMVKLFLLAGFTKGIILFDELEKVFPPLNSRERRIFTDSIRYYLIDGDNENTKKSFYEVLFTIHPYLQELMNPHWDAAGLERFASLGGDSAHDYTIYFKPIEEKFAIPLASQYLKACRPPGKESDELYPFGKDALQEALKIKGNVPGLYLSFLHTVVDKTIDSGVENIGIKEIKEISNAENPAEPEIDSTDEMLPPALVNMKDR
jgi:hypothetical protein